MNSSKEVEATACVASHQMRGAGELYHLRVTPALSLAVHPTVWHGERLFPFGDLVFLLAQSPLLDGALIRGADTSVLRPQRASLGIGVDTLTALGGDSATSAAVETHHLVVMLSWLIEQMKRCAVIFDLKAKRKMAM